MDLADEYKLAMTRRHFFARNSVGIGGAALASLLSASGFAADSKTGGLPGLPHFPPKAKRVIFLHQSGAPSQMELFDYKPNLVKLQGTELPDSIRQGQRITGMTSGQSSFPVAPSIFKFNQYGKSGTWISELLPHHAKIVDDITIIKSVYSEAINHDPAITFLQTGFQQPGRPSMGSWVSYGLGSENQNLPAFVDRKSTRLNSSHGYISYAVFCLKKKKKCKRRLRDQVILVSQFNNTAFMILAVLPLRITTLSTHITSQMMSTAIEVVHYVAHSRS